MTDITKGNKEGMDVDEEDKREDVSLLREDGNVNFDIDRIVMDIKENRVYLIGMLVKVYMRVRMCLSLLERKGVVSDAIKCIYLYL